MDDDPRSEFPSDTRQLTSEDRRIAEGDGPSWVVVVAIVIAVVGVAAYFVAVR